jgi:hypothetical protein
MSVAQDAWCVFSRWRRDNYCAAIDRQKQQACCEGKSGVCGNRAHARRVGSFDRSRGGHRHSSLSDSSRFAGLPSHSASPTLPKEASILGGFMSARLGTIGFGGVVVAALMAFSTSSHAYTADQQQLCTGDAFRLCSSAIPDVDRVTACMIQNRANLSPGCAQFFRRPAAQNIPVTTRKPSAKSRKAKKPARIVS